MKNIRLLYVLITTGLLVTSSADVYCDESSRAKDGEHGSSNIVENGQDGENGKDGGHGGNGGSSVYGNGGNGGNGGDAD